MSTMLLPNGPNLGILGRREPKTYGTDTLADIERTVADEVSEQGWKVLAIQREPEAELVSATHDHGPESVGAVVNPGALMIAGWTLTS